MDPALSVAGVREFLVTKFSAGTLRDDVAWFLPVEGKVEMLPVWGSVGVH